MTGGNFVIADQLQVGLPPRRKAYSYLRFSSPEQARGDSYRRQTSMAASYAMSHNLDLDEALTFQDLGVSAYRGLNAETGKLGCLLEAVRMGLIMKSSVILVESLDRLSRQAARKALRLIESILETGVSVVTLTDGREYTLESLDSDPLNLLIALLTFIRANEESAIKSHRIAASWVAKRDRAREQPLTARCPGWLRLTADRKSFVLVPEQAAVVQRIFSDALAGYGVLAISWRLNVEGAPRLTGGSRVGKMWYSASVSRLLNAVSTIGTLQPYKVAHSEGRSFRVPLPEIPNYYPAVVSPETFERVQKVRDAATSARRRKQAGMPAYNIIGRLARCSLCGNSMMLVSKSERGHYLVCRQAYGRIGCSFRSIRYAEVEASIICGLPSLLPLCRFPPSHTVQRHVDVTYRALGAPKLDRPALNASLRQLTKSVTLFPDEGMLCFVWKHGHQAQIDYAFTSATKRESKGLLRCRRTIVRSSIESLESSP